jgi:hypothetical protein
MYHLQRKASKEDKADQKVIERIEVQEKEQGIIKQGLEALLHDRLYQACRYYIGKKKITEAELKNTEYLYNSYHALGGNGTGTELYKRCCALPLDLEGGGQNETETENL